MKTVYGLIAAMTLAISSMTGKELPEVKAIIPLTDLTVEKGEELLRGDYSDIAIRCEQGTELPLQFLGNYGLFSIKYVPHLTITVDQTFYLRYFSNKVYISTDLIEWTKGSDFLNGKTLKADAGVSADQSHVLINTYLIDQPETSLDDLEDSVDD